MSDAASVVATTTCTPPPSSLSAFDEAAETVAAREDRITLHCCMACCVKTAKSLGDCNSGIENNPIDSCDDDDDKDDNHSFLVFVVTKVACGSALFVFVYILVTVVNNNLRFRLEW